MCGDFGKRIGPECGKLALFCVCYHNYMFCICFFQHGLCGLSDNSSWSCFFSDRLRLKRFRSSVERSRAPAWKCQLRYIYTARPYSGVGVLVCAGATICSSVTRTGMGGISGLQRAARDDGGDNAFPDRATRHQNGAMDRCLDQSPNRIARNAQDITIGPLARPAPLRNRAVTPLAGRRERKTMPPGRKMLYCPAAFVRGDRPCRAACSRSCASSSSP